MRRLFKYVPILMSVLTSMFLFSVGFSSWLVTKPLEVGDVDGSFQAHEVNDFVSWKGTTMFEYTSLYFKDDELNKVGETAPSYKLGDSNRGQITVTYSLTDAGKAAALDGGLTVTFRLGYTDANGTLRFKSSNTKVTVNGSVYSLSGESAQASASHTFNTTNGIPEGDFTVIYEFNTTVGAGFRSEFGQYLLNNKKGDDGVYRTTKFVTSAEAEVSG